MFEIPLTILILAVTIVFIIGAVRATRPMFINRVLIDCIILTLLITIILVGTAVSLILVWGG